MSTHMRQHQLIKNHAPVPSCFVGGIEIESFGGTWRHQLVSGCDFDDFLGCRQDEPQSSTWFGWVSATHFLAVHYLCLFYRVFTTQKTMKTGKFYGKSTFFHGMFSLNGIISYKVGFFQAHFTPLDFIIGKWPVPRSKWTPESRMVVLQGESHRGSRHRRFLVIELCHVQARRKIATP